MEAFFRFFTKTEEEDKGDNQDTAVWGLVLSKIQNSAVICLILTVIIPPVTVAAGPIMTPAVLISMAAVLFKLMRQINEAADQLEQRIEGRTVPLWVNNCLDSR